MNEFSRIDPEDEHAARFLVGHGITSASLRATAEAQPDLAPWCLKMVPLVDALTVRCGDLAPLVLADYRCSLPAGHEGEHEHAGCSWFARRVANRLHMVPPATGSAN